MSHVTKLPSREFAENTVNFIQKWRNFGTKAWPPRCRKSVSLVARVVIIDGFYNRPVLPSIDLVFEKWLFATIQCHPTALGIIE